MIIVTQIIIISTRLHAQMHNCTYTQRVRAERAERGKSGERERDGPECQKEIKLYIFKPIFCFYFQIQCRQQQMQLTRIRPTNTPKKTLEIRSLNLQRSQAPCQVTFSKTENRKFRIVTHCQLNEKQKNLLKFERHENF